MSHTRLQEPITLDRLVFLQQPTKKNIIWKDFGAYLEKKVDTHLLNPPRVTSDSSSLSLVDQYRICNLCGRPIGSASLVSHYFQCVEMKQRKEPKKKRARVEESSVESSRNTTPMTEEVKPRKKYKKSKMQKEKEAAAAAAAAASAGTDGAKRKTKKLSKLKGPVDVEKQCGVPLPLGGFCARSLTCKTHSMGAKRAVPGRLAPYDVLLQQYQKRNQAKLAANNALAAQRREDAAFAEPNELVVAPKPLDADEETHLVLEGLLKNHPVPLERKVWMPVRSRHRFLYMRESYANALITTGGASGADALGLGDQTLANQAILGSIGGLQGRCTLVSVDLALGFAEPTATQLGADIPGEIYQVRAPSKAVLMTLQHNTMQQQLFQQQVMKHQQMLLLKQRQAAAAASQQPSASRAS